MSYGNLPTTEPDHQGLGCAWKIPMTRKEEKPDWAATVSMWLVSAPYAHPFWWWYAVTCISLRDIPGVPPATVQFPGATHEIMFVALNPERPIPDLADWQGMSHLEPLDLVHQFIVGSDEDAEKLTEVVVKHIVAGNSPDQDHRSYWRDAINLTAEHLRLDGHPG